MTDNFQYPKVGIDTSSPLALNVNSADTAFTITQTGAGNCFLVEDATSPDTTPFVINTAGKILKNRAVSTNFVGVGGEAELQMHGASLISLSAWSTFEAVNPTITFTKSGSSTVGNFIPITIGHVLGTIDFAGCLDGYFLRGVQIIATSEYIDNLNSSLGANLVFRTKRTTGGGNPLETMRLNSQGFIGINQNSPLSQLHLGATAGVADSATICLDQKDTSPPLTTGGRCKMYMKNNKLIVQFNDGGTVQYKYLDLTGSTVTWTYTTTAP